MRKLVIVFFVLCCMVSVATAQMIKRTDAIWARTTTAPITIDGVLAEPAWAVAESVEIRYGDVTYARSAGMPGSGWKLEVGRYPSDPTRATVKFLAAGDSLYVAVIARDRSIGGGLFNHFDGLLMNMRRKDVPDRPAPPFEYFYAWVTEGWGCGPPAGALGALPCFMGWAGGARTDSLRKIWDAATTVVGAVNNDVIIDDRYIMELKFNVKERGYDIRRPAGDIVMFNLSVYDADWQWPLDTLRIAGNRAWLQGPWGNASWYNHIRIFARPDITTTSPLPPIGPDLRIPDGRGYPPPVIDGTLGEAVWRDAPSFKIKYGDVALRGGYPNTGPFRSGQFQPSIGGITAPVVDPSEATVRYFFRGDTLYLGFDVFDRVVQFHSVPDRYDGFRVTINDRRRLHGADSNLYVWQARFFVNAAGTAGIDEETPFLRDSIRAARVALRLKGGTTVDTVGAVPDSGYTAELAIDLTKLGYPAGRGDGVAFLGVTYYDGDSFIPVAGSYATRTWWFREHAGGDGPAWAYLDPTFLVVSVEEVAEALPKTFELIGNYPNPFNPSTVVQYRVAEPGTVKLLVFDVLGRQVASVDAGFQLPGVREIEFASTGLSSGTYFYRLEMVGVNSKRVSRTATGKMLLLK